MDFMDKNLQPQSGLPSEGYDPMTDTFVRFDGLRMVEYAPVREEFVSPETFAGFTSHELAGAFGGDE